MSGEVLVVAAVIGCLGALVVLAAVVADIQESSGRQKGEHRSSAFRARGPGEEQREGDGRGEPVGVPGVAGDEDQPAQRLYPKWPQAEFALADRDETLRKRHLAHPTIGVVFPAVVAALDSR